MATDSDIKLTKFKSAVTVVTADFANSIFGGLYGSAGADSMDEEDPRVRGHVHSGIRGDGHAPRVHLVDHVTDRLTNPNLGDDAVTKRTVLDTVNVTSAIPEYRVDGVHTYYYLDLRHIRADLVFQEDEDPAGDGSQPKLIRQRSTTFDGAIHIPIPDVWESATGFDFVFGSSSLEDLSLAGGEGDSRFQFDKSKSAFRAGRVTGSYWNDIHRGEYSVALGFDVAATEKGSTVSGGHKNISEGPYATISGGQDCTASKPHSSVGGGISNYATGDRATVGGGGANRAQGEESVVAGGQGNSSTGITSAIGGGENNAAAGDVSVISGGSGNTLIGRFSTIGGGSANEIDGVRSSILGGRKNVIQGDHSTIGGGVEVVIKADQATISGGAGNLVGNTASSISGGIKNVILSQYSVISGGSHNRLVPDPNNAWPLCDFSAIVGGNSNTIYGNNSTIIGAENTSISGNKSISIGGSTGEIKDSSHCILFGHGTHTKPLTIGVGYTAFNGRPIKATPSDLSGVIGGHNNHIVGGGIKGINNYIIGSDRSRLGAGAPGVQHSQIFGGQNNEITGVESAGPLKIMLNDVIVGGSSNVIYQEQHSTDVMYSGIFGGVNNGINHIPHRDAPDPSHHSDWGCIAPWYEPERHWGQSGYGVQTSHIFGGIGNAITSDPSHPSQIAGTFLNNSLYSAILGGQENVISSSYGSSILGGGAFIEHRNAGLTEPPYEQLPYHYSNVIVGGHHSSILNGTSNLIKRYAFPMNGTGPIWIPSNSKWSLDYLPEPLFCIAQGRESYSYLYGQRAYASGGHNWEKFAAQQFLSASYQHRPPEYPQPGPPTVESDYMVLLGSPWNTLKKKPWDQPGTAQASTLTFFGSWSYRKDEIDYDTDGDPLTDGDWFPGAGNNVPPWFEFKAYLDGGRDVPASGIHEPDRCFIPRYPASYQFIINGTISYTDMGKQHGSVAGGDYGIGWHDVISFTYRGYIVLMPDGSGRYGGTLTDVMASDDTLLNPLELFDPSSPAGLTGSHFSIGFCPEWSLAAGTNTTPLTAYNNNAGSPGFKARGDWPMPPGANAADPQAWPPHFSLYVVNNTGDVAQLTADGHPGMYAGANGTERELVGESLVARADVIENLLFLGKYGQAVITTPGTIP